MNRIVISDLEFSCIESSCSIKGSGGITTSQYSTAYSRSYGSDRDSSYYSSYSIDKNKKTYVAVVESGYSEAIGGAIAWGVAVGGVAIATTKVEVGAV